MVYVQDICAIQVHIICVCVQSLSHVQLFVTPWTVAHQAFTYMGFSEQQYQSGLPFPPPGDFLYPGIEPESPVAPATSGFFTTEPSGKLTYYMLWYKYLCYILTYSHKHATYMQILHSMCTCLIIHPYTPYICACYMPFYMCASIHVLDGYVTNLKYTCMLCAFYMYIFMGMLPLLLSRFSRVRLCATPQTAAHQALPSLGFSRQEHWSGLPFPPPMHESEK